ncbi:coiled-coil domain-containing protein MAD1 PWA37_003370 [Arxiozyma heterogenica]|uniref:coiled-coil domain-containing protein MAD1 n=1 Tax=Arxiozyma heterogenica TaxID=278026 RepID=UPI002EE4E59E
MNELNKNEHSSSDDDDSGRSSSFIDTPSNGIEKDNLLIDDVSNKDNNNLIGDNNEDNILSLQYKLETQRNNFELKLLQLERKYNHLEMNYNSKLEELELSNSNVIYMKEKEQKIQEQLTNCENKYNQMETELNQKIQELSSELIGRKQSFNTLKINNDQKINKLESDAENYQITIQNLQQSIDRYEATIGDQSREIVTLTNANNQKDEEIICLKQLLSNSNITTTTTTTTVNNNDSGNSSHDTCSSSNGPNVNNKHIDTTSTNETDELTTITKLFQSQIKYTTQLEETNRRQEERIKVLENSSDLSKYWKSEVDSLQMKLQEFEMLQKDYQNSQLELLELKSKLAEWNLYKEEQEQKEDQDRAKEEKNNDKDNHNDDTNNIIKDEQNSSQENNNRDYVLEENNPSEILHELSLTKKENVVLIEENNQLNININSLKILNEELALERNQLLDLNKTYEINILSLKKLNYEYEQQKVLINEECKLLRNQLNEFVKLDQDTLSNDSRNNDDNNNKNNGELVQKGLETLVDDYKNRSEELTNDLKLLNEKLANSLKEEKDSNNKKRKLGGSPQSSGLTYYSQRINELQLENAKLNRDLGKYKNLNRLLDEKLKRLIILKEKKIRILQLRDNPLAKEQFVKRKQLALLKEENEDLLKKLQSSTADIKSVPLSVVKTMEFELRQCEKELFKSNKRFTRLREFFNKKSLEFIEVVNSILGFKLEFQQNNKVKIYSCFRPDKYLVLDLVKNTLVSNLNLSNWEELLSTWIEQREQIPCFLATITLQLWQETVN